MLIAWLTMYSPRDITNGPPLERWSTPTAFWLFIFLTNFVLLRWCWKEGRHAFTEESKEPSALQDSEPNQ